MKCTSEIETKLKKISWIKNLIYLETSSVKKQNLDWIVDEKRTARGWIRAIAEPADPQVRHSCESPYTQ